jgi:hypothetical protein
MEATAIRSGLIGFVIEGLVQVVGYVGSSYQVAYRTSRSAKTAMSKWGAATCLTNGCADKLWIVFRLLQIPWLCQAVSSWATPPHPRPPRSTAAFLEQADLRGQCRLLILLFRLYTG